MAFKDIAGQEDITRYLSQSIKNNRIGHAYILVGQEDSIKGTIALAFAKAIFCQNFDMEACGYCAACIKIESGNHPDLRIIQRDRLHIVNEQIKELQKDILLKPYESDKKIYIIADADTMTESAQNRLLKTLEEPPPYALILLLSTNVYGFLPTIRSRCQIIKLQSDGFFGKAVDLKVLSESQLDMGRMIDIIGAILENDRIRLFSFVEFFKENKKSIDGILDWMLLWFRDMLIFAETGSEELLVNPAQREYLNMHAWIAQKEKIPYIIDQIEAAKRNIKANVNFELAIEIMLLRIQEG